MKIKNKRGDIPITILVIGVLAVCGLALLSFYLSDKKVSENFLNQGILEKAIVLEEKIQVYDELGFSKEEIDGLVSIEYDLSGRRHIFLEGEGITVTYFLPG
ncbi:MAG: hypothetical protein WDZ62_00995 [Candidatus Pacearchaeota archaeon]